MFLNILKQTKSNKLIIIIIITLTVIFIKFIYFYDLIYKKWFTFLTVLQVYAYITTVIIFYSSYVLKNLQHFGELVLQQTRVNMGHTATVISIEFFL